MLTVLDASGWSQKRFSVVNGTLTNLRLNSMAIRGFVPNRHEVDLGLDFLNQGRAFDRFNNKRLATQKISGTVCVTPDTGNPGRGVKPGNYRVVSEPPSIAVTGASANSRYWLVLNYCDFVAYSPASSFTGGYKYSVEYSHFVSFRGHVSFKRHSFGIALRKNGAHTVVVESESGSTWGQSNSDILLLPKTYLQIAIADLAWPSDPVNFTGCDTILYEAYRQACLCWDLAFFTYVNSGKSPSYSSKEVSRWVNPDFDAQSLKSYMTEVVKASRRIELNSAEKSTQARRVIENLSYFNSNLIAYASDLKKTGDTVRSVLKLLDNPKSPKAWASAWLSGRYGDRLAVSDTRELLTSLREALTTRLTYAIGRDRWRDSRIVVLHDDTISVAYERLAVVIVENGSYNGLMTSIETLMRWDAWPTLENAWDAVPLSFLVDWVLPVGDILGQIDAAVEAPYLRPVSQYVGQRVEMTIPGVKSLGLVGTITFAYYQRRSHDVLDEVKPFDLVTSPPSFSVVHAGDALALLVQTSKRV